MIIKTKEEINNIKYACSVLKIIIKKIKKILKPGINGIQLNNIVEKMIFNYNCIPNFKGLYNFPASICVSKNNVLVHGIPDNIPFLDGDLISIDVGCSYKGYNSDAAFTTVIGNFKKKIHKKLVFVTEKALIKSISILKPGIKIGDIGYLIQNYIESNGFFLPIEFSGHGIGKKLHEKPYIPNYGIKETGFELKSGMTICIEPMAQIKSEKIKFLDDNWTPVSENGEYNAHFEHTILITDNGYEILT